jgi:hypothetical protein
MSVLKTVWGKMEDLILVMVVEVMSTLYSMAKVVPVS